MSEAQTASGSNGGGPAPPWAALWTWQRRLLQGEEGLPLGRPDTPVITVPPSTSPGSPGHTRLTAVHAAAAWSEDKSVNGPATFTL